MSRSKNSNNTDLALKAVLFSAAAVFAVFIFYELRVFIVCLILAVTIASAITPIAEAAEKRRIPRLMTVLMLYLAAATAYGTLMAFLAPAIHEQWSKLSDNLPDYLSRLNSWCESKFALTGNSSDALNLSAADIRSLSVRILHQTVDASAGFIGLLLNTTLTLFLAACFVVEANVIWSAVLKWLPPPARARFAALILPLSARMGGYVRGQLLVALAVAIFLVAGFSLINLRYALVLGILAGLLNLVPYVGSLIASAFAVIVAFNDKPVLALAVVLICSLEQWVESSFMVPFFLGKHVSLHPLIVLISIIVGASLMGVPGALVSVPIASAAIYLAEEFYVKNLANENGDASSLSPEP